MPSLRKTQKHTYPLIVEDSISNKEFVETVNKALDASDYISVIEVIKKILKREKHGLENSEMIDQSLKNIRMVKNRSRGHQYLYICLTYLKYKKPFKLLEQFARRNSIESFHFNLHEDIKKFTNVCTIKKYFQSKIFFLNEFSNDEFDALTRLDNIYSNYVQFLTDENKIIFKNLITCYFKAINIDISQLQEIENQVLNTIYLTSKENLSFSDLKLISVIYREVELNNTTSVIQNFEELSPRIYILRKIMTSYSKIDNFNTKSHRKYETILDRIIEQYHSGIESNEQLTIQLKQFKIGFTDDNRCNELCNLQLILKKEFSSESVEKLHNKYIECNSDQKYSRSWSLTLILQKICKILANYEKNYTTGLWEQISEFDEVTNILLSSPRQSHIQKLELDTHQIDTEMSVA